MSAWIIDATFSYSLVYPIINCQFQKGNTNVIKKQQFKTLLLKIIFSQ